jgi:hypothetical protein
MHTPLPQWVKSGGDDRGDAAAHVCFAPESGQNGARKNDAEIRYESKSLIALLAASARLQAEKGAAEAKARAMEFVAYGAIIGLILLVLIIVSALVIRRRKTTPAAEHASVGPEPREGA